MSLCSANPRTSSGEAFHMRTLNDLPYDLIRILCLLLDGKDIVSVLSTCKALHTHVRDESIWREVCARYGLESPEIFGTESYFRIYSCVLHTFGALLGLWASDLPYLGTIIEFRFDAEYQGIVGEIWKFTRHNILVMDMSVWRDPSLPHYAVVLSITLPSQSTEAPHAQINWHDAPNYERRGRGGLPPGQELLHVLDETNESLYFYHDHHPSRSLIPDFPAPNASWYDGGRGMPRLRPKPSPRSRALLREDAYMCMSRTEHAKPRALVMYNPNLGSHHLGPHDPLRQHDMRIAIPDLRNEGLAPESHNTIPFTRRFYPMRSVQHAGQDPEDERWQPESLEGLWLGAYGPHGTEVLWVGYDAENKVVHASKITGDLNVPRGAPSWSFSIENRVRREEMPSSSIASFETDHVVRFYSGVGTICTPGFTENERGESENYVGIIGPNDIRINWRNIGIDHCPRYTRYLGRNISSETD